MADIERFEPGRRWVSVVGLKSADCPSGTTVWRPLYTDRKAIVHVAVTGTFFTVGTSLASQWVATAVLAGNTKICLWNTACNVILVFCVDAVEWRCDIGGNGRGELHLGLEYFLFWCMSVLSLCLRISQLLTRPI